MQSIVETVSIAILLVLLILFVAHLTNGTAIEWLKSKFTIVDNAMGTP